ncbi:hypothetical protein CY35_06G113200 [Sphagnum magellanicum]|nr:hypothetical protein CY35_06G113200 [Sphagnum magellanicum]
MAGNPHAFVNRISAAAGGRKEYSAGAANVLLMLTTLLVVGCRSGCDAAAYNEIISMPEILAFDPAFDLLQQTVIEQVVETGESQVIRLELLRRDHHPSLTDSTSTQPPKSSSERFLEAVKRSHARRDAIARSMQSAPKSSNSVKPSSIPVTTQGQGEYLTQIGLGTPKKTLTLIVDTGSDLVWTQCLACKSCYSQIDPIFNPANSSTYKPVKCGINLCEDLELTGCPAAGCQYVYGYGDGSSTIGNFATDTVTLGNASVPSLGFGCGHDQTGSFTGADGIVGLGQGPLSLISQLFSKGVISKRFSYCLVDMDSQNTSPLLLGDPAVTSAPPGVAYTPIQANPFNPTYYYLNLTGISVSGTPVKYPAGTFAIDSTSGNGGLIIDSGTTITYLATDGYNAVIAAVKANLTYPLVSGSEYGLDVCFDIGNATTLILPTIVFHFTGKVDVVLPIGNLYVLVATTGPIICLAIAGNDGFSIFGNIQQQNNLIVYDLNPQKFQIGFKSITCG